jgi:8-oxo-dGTP diphosphatase
VEPRVVVAAAVIDSSGRLLAARRTSPAQLAGLWELPGGKVEPGESEAEALVRELHEELGVEVTVGPLVGEWPLDAGYLLRVYVVTVEAGVPVPLQDHDEVSWLEADAWPDLDWVPADRLAVAALNAELPDTRTRGNVPDVG